MIVVGEGQGKGERIDEDRKMEGKEMTLLQGTWMVIGCVVAILMYYKDVQLYQLA